MGVADLPTAEPIRLQFDSTEVDSILYDQWIYPSELGSTTPSATR
jgi:hypothetical protein